MHVYFNGRRLTDKAISLRAPKAQAKVLVPVRTFKVARRGAVTVKVVSRGKPVRLEGVGVSRR